MARLALAAALLAACAPGPRPMAVRAEPSFYSPAMSAQPGIALTPVFTPASGQPARFRWHASFGAFSAPGGPGLPLQPLGPEAESGPATLWWSYDPAYVGVRKPRVTITIDAEGPDERSLARAVLELDWDRDLARLRE